MSTTASFGYIPFRDNQETDHKFSTSFQWNENGCLSWNLKQRDNKLTKLEQHQQKRVWQQFSTATLTVLNTSCSNYSKREKRDHTPITSLFWLSLDEWNGKCSTTELIQPSWLIWLSFRKRPVFQTIRVRRNDDEKSLWWRYIWAQLQASIPETMLKQICITVIFLCYFESLKFEGI